MLPCCLPFGKAGGIKILRCCGFVVKNYDFTLRRLDSESLRLLVTVGMPVARHPPYRSRRALLTHRAPTLGTDVQLKIGVRMHHTDFGQPPFDQTIHAVPV
jgi:hypothetical protein